MHPYELKLKITDSQEQILQSALKSLELSMFRFGTPSINNGTLTIDPFDFAQIVTYMQRSIQDEMEIYRLKKLASVALAKKQARCRKESSREAYAQMLEKLEWAKPKANLKTAIQF